MCDTTTPTELKVQTLRSLRLKRAADICCVGLALVALLCIAVIAVFPLLLLVTILRLILGLCRFFLDASLQAGLWLLLRYIYPSRLGYLHVWFLKPPKPPPCPQGGLSRNRRQAQTATECQRVTGSDGKTAGNGTECCVKAPIKEPPDTETQKTEQKSYMAFRPSADAILTDIENPTRLRRFRRRRPYFHSRMTKFDSFSATGSRVTIHTIPCLVDNYAYLIVDVSESDSEDLHSSVSMYAKHYSPRSEASHQKNGDQCAVADVKTSVRSDGNTMKPSCSRLQAAGLAHGFFAQEAQNAVSASSRDFIINQVEEQEMKHLEQRESSLPGVSRNLPCSQRKPLRAVIIDACESDAILRALVHLSASCYEGRPIIAEAIFTTHHHWDHQGGNRGLVKKLGPKAPNGRLKVYGSHVELVDCATHTLKHEDEITVGNLLFQVIETPCHTRGSLVFKLVTAAGHPDCVFTGDTMFLGGCGAPFEGTEKEMQRSFWLVQRYCDPSSMMFPGHEYTVRLLWDILGSSGCPLRCPRAFFTLVGALYRAVHLRHLSPPVPTIPYKLQEELQYNPNFRPTHQLASLLRRTLRLHPQFQSQINETLCLKNLVVSPFPLSSDPRLLQIMPTQLLSSTQQLPVSPPSSSPFLRSDFLFVVVPSEPPVPWRSVEYRGVPNQTPPSAVPTSHVVVDLGQSNRAVPASNSETRFCRQSNTNDNLKETCATTVSPKDCSSDKSGSADPQNFRREPVHAAELPRRADGRATGLSCPTEPMNEPFQCSLSRVSAPSDTTNTAFASPKLLVYHRHLLESLFAMSPAHGTSPVTVVWTQELVALLDNIKKYPTADMLRYTGSRLEQFLQPDYLDQQYYGTTTVLGTRSHRSAKLSSVSPREATATVANNSTHVTPRNDPASTSDCSTPVLESVVRNECTESSWKPKKTIHELQKQRYYSVNNKELIAGLEMIAYQLSKNPAVNKRSCSTLTWCGFPRQRAITEASDQERRCDASQDLPGGFYIAESDFIFLLTCVEGSGRFSLKQAQACWFCLCAAYKNLRCAPSSLGNGGISELQLVVDGGVSGNGDVVLPDHLSSGCIRAFLPLKFLVQQLSLSPLLYQGKLHFASKPTDPTQNKPTVETHAYSSNPNPVPSRPGANEEAKGFHNMRACYICNQAALSSSSAVLPINCGLQ